ncbi:MAG: class I SAM-dependent methyltransferase [Bacteroidota bacterium]
MKNNEMIEFPCPVCNTNDFKIKYPDTIGEKTTSFDYNYTANYNLTYRIVECNHCSHNYASPRPSDMWSSYSGDNVDQLYLSNQKQRIATNREVIKYITKYKKGGKLLDVGCATGDFLMVAKDYFDVEGLELSEWSSKIAKADGFKIHHKLLNQMGEKEEYDVVTLWGVIEHFEFPKTEIENISKILKKGGHVSLWTGDVSSVMANLLGKKWWYYQGQHIQMFTKKSICELFNSCGYKTVYYGRYPYIATMESLNNSISRYPFISRLISPIIKSKLFSRFRLKLKLSGEIFAIFEKTN